MLVLPYKLHFLGQAIWWGTVPQPFGQGHQTCRASSGVSAAAGSFCGCSGLVLSRSDLQACLLWKVCSGVC